MIAVNILSLASVTKSHRVWINTDIDNTLYVFNKDGSYIQFGLYKTTNLYLLDINVSQPELSLSHTIAESEKEKYPVINSMHHQVTLI